MDEIKQNLAQQSLEKKLPLKKTLIFVFLISQVELRRLSSEENRPDKI